MGKFFKINVLSIQLKKEMARINFPIPTHKVEMRKASQIDKESMRPLPSFKAYVDRLRSTYSSASKLQKVDLLLARTGTGKSSLLINELAQYINEKVQQTTTQKKANNLIVLCLPRRLACKLSIYLQAQYGLNVEVKHGKVKETVGDLVSPDTQVLIMTYRSAVNILCGNQLSGRQISLIFDECHESCAEAVMVYKLMGSLFAKKPDWLHSLFFVSATMDPVELSKRLKIEREFIQVSKIEPPPKPFPIGAKQVIPINVGDDDEEDKAVKPLEKKGKEKGKDKSTKAVNPNEKEDKEKPQPILTECTQGMARQYNKRLIHLVVENIIDAPKLVNESTVIITDGLNSAKTMIASLTATFKQTGVNHVRFWNTFVQQECPAMDLSMCHLIIIGSHMKLSSSITFPRCTELHIWDIMQVASQNLRNATVQLFRGLVPKSVLDQCFGRADRDVSTRTRYYPAIFPSDFQITRLEYPKQDEVSEFILEFIDVSVSRTPEKTRTFCSHYNLTMRQAEDIFFSQLPVELLLALHRYAKTEVSEEKKEYFLKSLNVLRALAHTIAFFSDDEHRIVKPTSLAHTSNVKFAQCVGIFVVHILNKVCGFPTEQKDSVWESRFGVSEETLEEIVLKINLSIRKDGLGPFVFSGLKEEITPDVILEAISFSRDYELSLLPFFLKHNPEFIFPTATDDDVLPEDQLDKAELRGFSILPYGILKSAGGACISPAFIISLVSMSEQPQQQCEGGGSAKPQPRQKCAGGGSAQKQPQQQKCAGGGSAQKQPQQQQCSRGCHKK